MEWGCGDLVEWDGCEFLSIGFVEVSRKLWGVDPVREDKYLAARGCVYMCVSAVDCLF